MTGQDVINDFNKLETCKKSKCDDECLKCSLFRKIKNECSRDFGKRWNEWTKKQHEEFTKSLETK